MSRFSRAPLFAQVLALVVVTAIVAQIASFGVAAILPGGKEPFTLRDTVAVVLSQSSLERNGYALEAVVAEAAPAGWGEDDRREQIQRVTLAALLGRSPNRVLVEDQIPLPGGQWLIRLARKPSRTPIAAVQPAEDGADVRVGDFASAVQLDDGSWLVITPVDAWPGPGIVLLLWLAFNALLLVPIAWLFTRRVVRPIQQFANTADRAGRGDAGAVFTGSGPSEIRAAAHALSEMQRKVQGALDERTKLLAAIAHDLRTPLTRIRFRAEHAPPEQRARINEDVERMDAMIAGVLAFVRGEQSVERQNLDLSALVQSVVDDWTDSGSQISLTETPPVLVDGDAMALRRMITNIIDNAVRYGRQTHCRVERTNGDAVLTVDDAGPGVEEADYARLLSPFERGASNRDPSTGGVGLGLPIARGIAHAHGGELSLHRSELGGLKVRVRIPIP